MLAIFYNKSMKNIPNLNKIFPNEKIPSLCYIKNVIKNPNIIVGDYTYYNDVNGAEQFEKHTPHHYDFIGDKLIIGKFCAIAKDISPYTIAVGNPCKVAQKRFDDELTELLLKFKWWNKSIEEINNLIPLLSDGNLENVKAKLCALI